MSEDEMPAGAGHRSGRRIARARRGARSADWRRLSRRHAVASVHAELKVEAVRAGIVDLDGLKLLDSQEVELTSRAANWRMPPSSWRNSGERSHGCSVARRRPARPARPRRSLRGKSWRPK